MNFRTEIEPKSNLRIDHNSRILFLGSCFAQNISAKAGYFGFKAYHPFGAVYNPASVLNSIKMLAEGASITENELIEDKGLYSHYSFHSSYSKGTKEEALQEMNKELTIGEDFWNKADIVILTFGTARTYTLKSSGIVVANCHHTDQKEFQKGILSIDEIAEMYIQLTKAYPDKKFILTVSPIRYLKYGLHESRLDKATLLLAVDKICGAVENCTYFPSYEIMNDDLRDYRFFASDMIHPSDAAIDYIWEKFAECYFSAETKKLCTEYDKLRKLENHRPTRPGSAEDEARLQRIMEVKRLIGDAVMR